MPELLPYVIIPCTLIIACTDYKPIYYLGCRCIQIPNPHTWILVGNNSKLGMVLRSCTFPHYMLYYYSDSFSSKSSNVY